MAFDRFLAQRLDSKKKNTPPPKKEKSFRKKVFSALSTLEKFVLFSHVKEGRFVPALVSGAAFFAGKIILHKSDRKPRTTSVLSQRRGNPRKTFRQPSAPRRLRKSSLSRRDNRSRSIKRSQSRSRLTV